LKRTWNAAVRNKNERVQLEMQIMKYRQFLVLIVDEAFQRTAKEKIAGLMGNWAVRFTLKNRRRQPGLSGPKSANNGSDHFGVLGLRVAAASCHSGKQEQTSKRSVRQHVAILPVTGAIGPV
jgi:hypothetical protein